MIHHLVTLVAGYPHTAITTGPTTAWLWFGLTSRNVLSTAKKGI